MPKKGSLRLQQVLALSNAFAFGGGQTLLIALFPFLAETLGMSLSALIMTFGLGSLLFVVGSPYWAAKSDRWGRVRVLSIGGASLVFSFALLTFLALNPFVSLTWNVALLLLSRLIYGLGASAISPVAQALQADLAENSREMTKAMMLHSLSLGLGRALGLLLLVFSVIPIQYALLIALALMMVVTIATALVAFSADSLRASDEIQAKAYAKGSPWVSELKELKWAAIMAFTFTSFVEALNSSLAGTVREIFSLESIASGHVTARLLLFANLGVVLVQIVARRFVRAGSTRHGFLLGNLSLLLGAVLFAGASSPLGLYLALGPLILGIGIVPPLYLSLIRDGEKRGENEGRRAGLISSIQTLGFTAGAFLAAFSFYLGTHSGYALATLALVLIFAGLGVGDRRVESLKERAA